MDSAPTIEGQLLATSMPGAHDCDLLVTSIHVDTWWS